VAESLDGLISFYGSRHAIRADKTLRAAGLATELIPGPKDLSPNCGVALRFEFDERDRALDLLQQASVDIDEVHEYRPRTDAWERPEPAPASRRPFWRRR
jgi:hypothetical protein